MMHARSTIGPSAAQIDDRPDAAFRALLAGRRLAPAILVAIYVAFVLGVGVSRSYIGYDETDYVQFFIPEAQRFLAGEPLEGAYHPPLYPIVIATAYAVLGDWLAAGLAVSLLFGIVGFACSVLLCRRLGGPAAAWGAGLTLMGSVIFLGESARASGDAMFFALLVAACLLAIEALSANSRRRWLGCGMVAGLALITRTNAPPLLLLALAPLLGAGPRRARAADCAHLVAGLALPILVIVAYGAATSSHVWPTNNHLSLATSYFSGGEDRNSIDAALRVAGRFGSVTEVLLHDPIHIAATYLRDLYQLFAANITMLVEFPLYFVFLPGLLVIADRRWNGAVVMVLAIVLAELLLTNLKQFQARYYLFLVPLIGAGVGHMCWHVLGLDWAGRRRAIVAAAVAVMFVAAIGLALGKVSRGTRHGVAELAELVPAAAGRMESGAAIVARKPHLAFYAGAEHIHLPDLETLADLQEFLRARAARTPLYLLYGEVERTLRPQFRALQAVTSAPAWLEVVAASADPGQWVLYRYRRALPD